MATAEPTVIKKYANRRLYHTGTSTYVTLDDLARMVKRGEDFIVTDAKTSEDITRAVLGQIIFEQENRGQSLMPIAFLRQLIRYYGDSMQTVLPAYLESSLSSFSRNQEELRTQMSRAMKGDAVGLIEEQTRRNMEMFSEAMRMWVPFAVPGAGAGTVPGGATGGFPGGFPGSANGRSHERKAGDDGASGKADIEALRRQLDDMQRTIATLVERK